MRAQIKNKKYIILFAVLIAVTVCILGLTTFGGARSTAYADAANEATVSAADGPHAGFVRNATDADLAEFGYELVDFKVLIASRYHEDGSTQTLETEGYINHKFYSNDKNSPNFVGYQGYISVKCLKNLNSNPTAYTYFLTMQEYTEVPYYGALNRQAVNRNFEAPEVNFGARKETPVHTTFYHNSAYFVSPQSASELYFDRNGNLCYDYYDNRNENAASNPDVGGKADTRYIKTYYISKENGLVTDPPTGDAEKITQPISFDKSVLAKTYGDLDFTTTVKESYKSRNPVYTSSDTSVATVDENSGKVHILKAGQTVINAKMSKWGNFTETSASYTLTVAKKTIAIPSAVTGLTYNGLIQTGVAASVDGCYTITGNTKKDAGQYSAELTPTANYKWSDNTNSVKIVKWSIGKKNLTVSVDKIDGNTATNYKNYVGLKPNLAAGRVTYNIVGLVPGETASPTFTQTYDGNGKLVIMPVYTNGNYQITCTEFTSSKNIINYVKIGSTPYDTLQAAVNAASAGQTLTVVGTLPYSDAVTIAKSTTDANRKVLVIVGDSVKPGVINCDITVNDQNRNNNGNIDTWLYLGANLTVKGKITLDTWAGVDVKAYGKTDLILDASAKKFVVSDNGQTHIARTNVKTENDLKQFIVSFGKPEGNGLRFVCLDSESTGLIRMSGYDNLTVTPKASNTVTVKIPYIDGLDKDTLSFTIDGNKYPISTTDRYVNNFTVDITLQTVPVLNKKLDVTVSLNRFITGGTVTTMHGGAVASVYFDKGDGVLTATPGLKYLATDGTYKQLPAGYFPNDIKPGSGGYTFSEDGGKTTYTVNIGERGGKPTGPSEGFGEITGDDKYIYVTVTSDERCEYNVINGDGTIAGKWTSAPNGQTIRFGALDANKKPFKVVARLKYDPSTSDPVILPGEWVEVGEIIELPKAADVALKNEFKKWYDENSGKFLQNGGAGLTADELAKAKEWVISSSGKPAKLPESVRPLVKKEIDQTVIAIKLQTFANEYKELLEKNGEEITAGDKTQINAALDNVDAALKVSTDAAATKKWNEYRDELIAKKRAQALKSMEETAGEKPFSSAIESIITEYTGTIGTKNEYAEIDKLVNDAINKITFEKYRDGKIAEVKGNLTNASEEVKAIVNKFVTEIGGLSYDENKNLEHNEAEIDKIIAEFTKQLKEQTAKDNGKTKVDEILKDPPLGLTEEDKKDGKITAAADKAKEDIQKLTKGGDEMDAEFKARVDEIVTKAENEIKVEKRKNDDQKILKDKIAAETSEDIKNLMQGAIDEIEEVTIAEPKDNAAVTDAKNKIDNILTKAENEIKVEKSKNAKQKILEDKLAEESSEEVKNLIRDAIDKIEEVTIAEPKDNAAVAEAEREISEIVAESEKNVGEQQDKDGGKQNIEEFGKPETGTDEKITAIVDKTKEDIQELTKGENETEEEFSKRISDIVDGGKNLITAERFVKDNAVLTKNNEELTADDEAAIKKAEDDYKKLSADEKKCVDKLFEPDYRTITEVVEDKNGAIEFNVKKDEIVKKIKNSKEENDGKTVTDKIEELVNEIKNIEYGGGTKTSEEIKSKLDDLTAAEMSALNDVRFVQKQQQIVNRLEKELNDRKDSGKYSETGSDELQQICDGAKSDVFAETSSDGWDSALEDIYSETILKYDGVDVVKIVTGEGANESADKDDYDDDRNFGKDGYYGSVENDKGISSTIELVIEKEQNAEDINKVIANAGKNGNITVSKSSSLTAEQAKAALDDKELKLTIDVYMLKNGNRVDNFDGTYTVRVLLPKDIRGINDLRIVYIGDNGKVEVFDSVINGNYIVFTTTHFSEFLIIGEKTSDLLWLAIVLTVILLAELAVIFILHRKNKKNKGGRGGSDDTAVEDDGENAYENKKRDGKNGEVVLSCSFLPLLATVLLPTGILPTVIVLGSLCAGAGATIAYQAIKGRKTKGEAVNKLIAEDEATADYDDVSANVNPTAESFATESTGTAMPVFETDDDDRVVLLGADGGKILVTYNYSFDARLIQSPEDMQIWYHQLREYLLSYGLKETNSWKARRFYLKGKTYAKVLFRGKTLNAFFALDSAALAEANYRFEDAGDIKKYADVPVRLRIKSDRGCQHSMDLVDMMMNAAEIVKTDKASEEFVLCAFQTREELIEETLIKVKATCESGEEINPSDLKTSAKEKIVSFDKSLRREKITAAEAADLSDDVAAGLVLSEDEYSTGKHKGIVNVDSISAQFGSGDVVTVEALKEKRLIPQKVDYVKVLARGTLDKPLTVKAQDFSADAVKMIVIVGGTAIKIKVKS